MILEMEVESSYCSSFGILRILLYKNITSCIILHEVFLSNYVIRFVNYHMSSKNSKSHGTYSRSSGHSETPSEKLCNKPSISRNFFASVAVAVSLLNRFFNFLTAYSFVDFL